MAAHGPALLQRLSAQARLRRWDELARRFPDFAELRVLDLGGTVRAWEVAPTRPRHVTVVNLDSAGGSAAGDWFEFRQADACNLPPDLAGQEFDLVFCNSLIEHVGGHAQRRMLAETIHRAGPRHWVQTPYRYFPVEPHWMVPFMQFLPIRARAAVARRLPFGPAHRLTPGDELIDSVAYVELLSATEMRDYFPHSELWFERSLGLPKSLVAVRTA